jgi:hypothetical protein
MDKIYSPGYIHTQTTTVIAASGYVDIGTVVIPAATSGTVTFQDKSGTAYFVFPSSTPAGSYRFNCVVGNGLSVVTASADTLIVNCAL